MASHVKYNYIKKSHSYNACIFILFVSKVTRARAKHMIICSWLTALLISLPALYFYKMDTGVDSGMPPDKYCMGFVDSGPYPDRVSGVVYTIIYVVLLYVIPAAAVVVLYLKVFR